MNSTPFARWRENGEPDPHGEYYHDDIASTACGHYPSEVIALALVYGDHNHTLIFWLTAGKERLRWLSRKLYKETSDHTNINQQRARLLLGNLTDDELANQFYMTESEEDLQAGRERIMWLVDEIKNAGES